MKDIVALPELNPALEKLGTPTSLLVRGAGLLYSCGIPPMDIENGGFVSGPIEDQAETVLSIMQAALEGAGSSMEKVLKTTIYITDPAFFGGVNAAYIRYFPNRFPARSFVAVKPWPMPFDIEIDCVALE